MSFAYDGVYKNQNTKLVVSKHLLRKLFHASKKSNKKLN